MKAHTLLTYRNLEELRRIQEKQEVFPFAFGDTKKQIKASPKITIDISALVYFLQIEKSNILSVYINFIGMTNETVIIAEEAISQSALEILPYLLSNTSSFFPDEGGCPEHAEPVVINPQQRRKIYKYNNTAELDQIVQYSTEHGIPIATFASANGGLRQEFEQFNKTAELAIMDLTSVCYAIEDNKALIYAVEQLLIGWPNVKVIACTPQVDTLLKYFPLFFNGQESASRLLPDLPELGGDLPEESHLLKVTDLDAATFESFIDEFNHNLIGHGYFKERLRYALKNFIALNKAKEQKA